MLPKLPKTKILEQVFVAAWPSRAATENAKSAQDKLQAKDTQQVGMALHVWEFPRIKGHSLDPKY